MPWATDPATLLSLAPLDVGALFQLTVVSDQALDEVAYTSPP